MTAAKASPLSIECDLPEGWTSTVMGDIAEVAGGGTPKTSEPSNFSDEGHPWITPADLSGFAGMYVSHGRRGLTDKGLRSCSALMLPGGAVLMSSRAPIGYVAIAANRISTNQGFKSFVLPEGAMPEFVYFWLKFMKPELESMGSGSTFMEISGSRAREIPFILAPLAEQKRIVEKVEQLLARVNAARERLARVPAILKRFRQAVLAAACSGRLTADWRDQHPEADIKPDLLKELPRRKKKRAGRLWGAGVVPGLTEDERDSLPETWRWVKVREVGAYPMTPFRWGLCPCGQRILPSVAFPS